MTASNDLWRMVSAIRHATISPVDMDLLRPALPRA